MLMERGVHLPLFEITVAIETLNVKYKAKQRLNSELAILKPHRNLTCCVYVWGSLSIYKEGSCSCNLNTTLAHCSTESRKETKLATKTATDFISLYGIIVEFFGKFNGEVITILFLLISFRGVHINLC